MISRARALVPVPVVLLFGLAFPFDAVRADVVGSARPQAYPREVTVFRGQGTTVPLGVATDSPRQVEFRIAKPPLHGRIGEIAYNSGDTRNGVIEYVPPEDLEVTEDVFFYKARIPDLVVSEAVPVKIRIIEPEARLLLDQSLPFGRVLVGEEKRVPFQILNKGAGTFEATIAVPEPWFIPEEASHVVVRMNEAVLVPLVFRPTAGGAVNHRLVLQPESPRGSIELFGEGVSPFSASPSTIELAWNPATESRMGKSVVSNATDEPIRITVLSDKRLGVVDALEVPARGAVDLTTLLPAEDLANYSGELVLEGAGYVERIAVRAEVLPAVIEVVEPGEEGLRFNHVTGQPSDVREVKLRNSGGATVFVYGETVDPFILAEGNDSLALEPGKELIFHLTMKTGRIGDYDRELVIIGGPDTLRIPLYGSILQEGTSLPEVNPNDPARKESPTPKPSGRNTVGTGVVAPWAMEAYLRSVGAESEERTVSKKVPVVDKVFLKTREEKRLDIWWKHPPEKGEWSYVLETRWMKVNPESGMPEPYWFPLTGVEFKSDLDGVTAVLDGLNPGSEYVFRVVAQAKDGSFGVPSGYFLFGTADATRSTWWKWLLAILVFGGLGATYWLWRKRQLALS